MLVDTKYLLENDTELSIKNVVLTVVKIYVNCSFHIIPVPYFTVFVNSNEPVSPPPSYNYLVAGR